MQLEVYDLIAKFNPDLKLKPHQFTVSYDNDAAEFYFTACENNGEELLGWLDGPHGSFPWFVAAGGQSRYLDKIVDPSVEELAEIWTNLRTKVDKNKLATEKRRQNAAQKRASQTAEMQSEKYSGSELIVPISIEVDKDRGTYNDPDIPDDDYIISSIEQRVPIEDTNRYIKQIVVKFMISGVSICLYPKVRAERLRVDWKGKTTETQFNGACRALRRRIDDYLDNLSRM